VRPADGGLALLGETKWALEWPSGKTVEIEMASPDPQGAVAYYFDFLQREADLTMPTPEAVAASQYLFGLVGSKGLQPVRGPYVITAPDSSPTPTGWGMRRAVIWVEEFDLVVPVGPADEHGPVVPGPSGACGCDPDHFPALICEEHR
jgi:hypothetical protein